MSRFRWLRTATVAALALSVATFGTASPVQAIPDEAAAAAAKEAAAAPAAATPAGMVGRGHPVTVTKATIEEIQATAAKNNGQLFTISGDAGVSAIVCTLAISQPFGGGSPGASVHVDAALQCTDWVDFVSLYVELWRDLGQVANSGAAVPFIPAVYVSAQEGTCKYGIYWGVATGFVRRSGFTFLPSPWLHVHSVPLPVGCGSAPPPPPPPPGSAVTVTNPGFKFNYIWDTVAVQMTATGGSGSYAWSANGLPPGLHINASTGLIGGTVRATGTYTVTVTAAAGIGSTNFTSFTWTIGREPCPRC